MSSYVPAVVVGGVVWIGIWTRVLSGGSVGM